MIRGMEHVWTSPVRHSLDVAFSDAILMLSSNPTERDFLIQTFTIIFELVGCKDSIVSSILFDFEAFIAGHLLKLVLACHSLLIIG